MAELVLEPQPLSKASHARFQFAVIAALALTAVAAHAGPLYGSTVNYQWYYPDLSTTVGNPSNGNYVVGAGTEVHNATGSNQDITLDITANQIIFQSNERANITYFSFQVAFNGWELSDALGDIDAFASVTIDPSSTWAAFDTSRLHFSDNGIWANLEGLALNPGERLVLNVGTAEANTVPEPTSFALSSFALVGAGLMRRRMTKR